MQHFPRPKSKEQGSVIILILLILTALSCLALELSKETLVDYTSSTALQSTMHGAALCDSGRLVANKILMRDLHETTADHLFEQWGSFDAVLQSLSEELTSGTLTGNIEDENGRFPINRLVLSAQDSQQVVAYQSVFLRLITQRCKALGITSGTAESLLLSIRIWQGEELTRAKEDDIWYSSQHTPYV